LIITNFAFLTLQNLKSLLVGNVNFDESRIFQHKYFVC